MREARQPPEVGLDDVSANLGEVLRRADDLLVEWSAFGVSVKAQVEREAASVGTAVSNAVDAAVSRAVSAGLERAVPEQLTARMASLTAEITKLEHRARTAARSISDERVHDRRLLGVLVLAVLVANALLVMLLLRDPRPAMTSPEATRVEVAPAAVPLALDAAQGDGVIDAGVAPGDASANSAATAPIGTGAGSSAVGPGSGAAAIAPAKPATKPRLPPRKK